MIRILLSLVVAGVLAGCATPNPPAVQDQDHWEGPVEVIR